MIIPVTYIGHSQLTYDDGFDVLYISIGAARFAYRYENEQEGLLFRKDADSGEIVGVTIFDYNDHFRLCADLSWLVTNPFPQELVLYLWQRPVMYS